MIHDGNPDSFNEPALVADKFSPNDAPEGITGDLSHSSEVQTTVQAQLGQKCKDLKADLSSTPTEPGPDSGIERAPDNLKALFLGETDQVPQSDQGCKDLNGSTSLEHIEELTIKASPSNTYEIIKFDPAAPKPEIKRYAHQGKRRRSYTEELFRCQFVTQVVSDSLICGALLWKNRPQELRAHLLTHKKLEEVQEMSDDEVLEWYTGAKRIFLEKLPDDEVFGIDDDDLDDLEIDEELEKENNE